MVEVVHISPVSLVEATRLFYPLPLILDDVFAYCHLPEITIPDGSIYRPYAAEKELGRSGFHGWDDKDGEGHHCFDVPTPTWEDAQLIADKVNPLWVYDASRPHKMVVFAATHGTGPHCHVQAHWQTTRRLNDGERTV